jgi:hypothetical protein
VRTISRLTTGALLTVGTAGTGAAKAASWGGKLGRFSLPVLSLADDGLLALRMVSVSAGGVVVAAAPALSATYVLHMASVGAQGAGSGGGWPPVGGPGQWVQDSSHMSAQARAYQAQVTGAPKGWAYRVCRNGDCVDYDGYDHKTGTLVEGKALGYDKWFKTNLDPKFNFQGLKGLREQAKKQERLSGGLRVRWHVAEPRMVAILQRQFRDWGVKLIDVVYTPLLP